MNGMRGMHDDDDGEEVTNVQRWDMDGGQGTARMGWEGWVSEWVGAACWRGRVIALALSRRPGNFIVVVVFLLFFVLLGQFN